MFITAGPLAERETLLFAKKRGTASQIVSFRGLESAVRPKRNDLRTLTLLFIFLCPWKAILLNSRIVPHGFYYPITYLVRFKMEARKRPRLIPIPEKRRFAFSIVYLIFLIYSTFTPHFRESTAAPVMSAPGGALGPDGVPARIYRYRTFPVLQVVAPPYLHTHASTHASTHPPHTVAHNCGSTHPHTHTRTHIDTLTHPPTHPPPHTHHTHTHTPTHPHTHTHTAVARLAAARLGHVQPISARAPASGAVSRRRGHELPRRGGTRAGGPAIRLGPGHDIVAVFNLFDQLKHSLYNIYIYNIIIIERECCLLVLNLVSSTLSCIRQPRPRLPSY